jgi:hypothetical protein
MEKFNALLQENELAPMRLLLNQRISLCFEKANYHTDGMNFRIEGQGKISLVTTTNSDYYCVYVTIKPFRHFFPFPVVAPGGVSIDSYTIPNLPLAERLKIIHPPNDITSSFDNINFLPVSKIQFYGNRQSGYINELDPDVTLEHMAKYHNANEFPYVEIDSIELIAIIHEYRYVTLLMVEEYGFCVFFKDYESFSKDPSKDNDRLINGYEKNIVLQHEIC